MSVGLDIDRLLSSEKSRPGFTGDARAAMWKGIEQSVSTAAAVGAAATVTAAATKATAATTTTTATATATATATKLAAWKLGTLLSAAIALGAGAGAVAHARFAEPKTVYVDRAPVAVTIAPAAKPPPADVAPAVPASALPSAPEPEPARTVALAKASAATSPSASAAPKDPSLARERSLLDMARTALSRGDSSAALAALETHAREFPKSQLGQEREVLAIQALASANRMPEARRRAAAFRAAFPSSPLLSIVDEATQ